MCWMLLDELWMIVDRFMMIWINFSSSGHFCRIAEIVWGRSSRRSSIQILEFCKVDVLEDVLEEVHDEVRRSNLLDAEIGRVLVGRPRGRPQASKLSDFSFQCYEFLGILPV
ncbi:hypothetical protein Dimus_039004 [Dionaea muscipula]